MTEDYVCSLDAASIRKAKEELKENPEDRLIALGKFREVIDHQTWLRCYMSTYIIPFIVRFEAVLIYVMYNGASIEDL